MRPLVKSLTSLIAMTAVALAAVGSVHAAEQCKINTCSSSTATKTANGWKVKLKFRTGAAHYEFFNLRIHGHPQMEADGPGNNVELTLDVPADWTGTYALQACIDDRPIETRCDKWATFTTDLPKDPPPLSTPNAQFCNWYASEAVARSAQGAKCGFTGARWDPNKQFHQDWCMQQKSQQQGWSEHNARAGQLADCAKKEAASAPPKAPQSAGAPAVRVPQDVDVYKEPGGVGQPLGVLRGGTTPQLYESRPDQWCRVAGNAVPTGGGWVWCGEGFELKP